MKKPPRKFLNKQEKLILQTLYRARRFMSIKEIAEKAGMSWVTAKKYLKSLEDKKWIVVDEDG